jgi:hypothetical protein
MNLKIIFLALIFSLSYHPVTVNAAFPMKQEEPVLFRHLDQDYNTSVDQAISKSASVIAITKPIRETTTDASREGGELGLVSFGLGLIGLVSFVAAVAASMPGLLVVSFLSALGAVITGAMSFRRKNNGFAIAGFVMGMLEVVPLALLVAFLATAPYKKEE